MRYALILLLCAFCLPVCGQEKVAAQLEEALASYQQGEVAAELGEAEAAFNHALEIYQSLAVDYDSAKLYYNIGNCYFQLGELPWAILNYERAGVLAPRDHRICAQLRKARQRLGLETEANCSSLLSRMLLAGYISLYERIWCAVGLGLLLFFVGSLALWKSSRLLYRLAVLLASAACVTLASVFLLHYAVPIEGIVVKGSLLRCDAGDHYAAIDGDPLRGGSRIFIKQLTVDQRWAEVTTLTGERGYIRAENLRIL